MTRDYDRVSMHGVRRVLLERQAESSRAAAPRGAHPEGRDERMSTSAEMAGAFSEYRASKGLTQIVFGDLFLEDVRAYREQFLARHGMRLGSTPCGGRDTGRVRQKVHRARLQGGRPSLWRQRRRRSTGRSPGG